MTVDDLAAHLGFAAVPTDSEALTRALDTAVAIIQPYLIVSTPGPGQVAALDLATLTVAGDLWRRKDAPGGTYAFGDNSDYVETLPRDPLSSVWAWLVGAGLVNPAVVA